MLEIKLSLKFGKIIRNCLRNSAVSLGNHNENYNAVQKREIINCDRTIETIRIKIIFQKFCQKGRVDLEKRLITPNLVVVGQ